MSPGLAMKRLAATALICSSIMTASSYAQEETRALWLTRWSVTNDADVQAAVNYSVDNNYNTLLVQVYGDSMALYNSTVAPRSYLVSGSFDALESTITYGHAAGLEVHAYCNVFNAYSGGLGTPSDPDHIINAHPEWAMVDDQGNSMINNVGSSGTFVFYNPEHPGYLQYLNSIADEISQNYSIDGFHMDYIRFPGSEYDYGPVPSQNFFNAFGKQPSAGDPDWDQWRRDTVTNTVSTIYATVHGNKPAAKVSAAVWNTAGSFFQDPYHWLETGVLDSAYVMAYTSDDALFESFITPYNLNSGGREIIAGILATGNSVGNQIDIARQVGVEGQAIFDYEDMGRRQNRELSQRYTTSVNPFPMPWLDGSPDTWAPLLSDIAAVGVSDVEAEIRWHSDEKADSLVEYGLTTSYDSSAYISEQAFDHSVMLNALQANSTYHYRVTSTDPTGNSTTSSDQTFNTTNGGLADIIVDDGDPGYAQIGQWTYVSGAGSDAYNGDYYFESDQPVESASATWTPLLPLNGDYEVYIQYRAGSNRVIDAPYTVFYDGGSQTFNVNQQVNGSTFNLLGTFPFTAGENGYVKLGNQSSGGDVVIADAVMFRFAGNGEPTPTPTPSPTVTPSPTPTPTATPTPTPTPSPTPGGTMYVSSIVPGVQVAGGPNRNGQATVMIIDDLGNPVSAATVSGTFSGDFSESVSGTTDVQGEVTLTTSAKQKEPVTFTFCIDNVTAPNLSYEAGSNIETCDSY